MEPCGTPVDKERILEETPSISTYWVRPVYEFSEWLLTAILLVSVIYRLSFYCLPPFDSRVTWLSRVYRSQSRAEAALWLTVPRGYLDNESVNLLW